jgi:hypothetical protein
MASTKAAVSAASPRQLPSDTTGHATRVTRDAERRDDHARRRALLLDALSRTLELVATPATNQQSGSEVDATAPGGPESRPSVARS